MIEILSINQTTEFCSTIWEIKLNNGKMVYVNHGLGTIDISISKNKTDNIDDAIEGDVLYKGVAERSLNQYEMMPYLTKALSKL